MVSKTLRWAVLGASDIAAVGMIPALRAAGHEIVVVQSTTSEWAEAYAAANGIAAWTTSVDESVSRDDVDAVYVSSKNHLHRAQVEAAAAAGKHVFSEKPLALTLSDAQAMVDACENAGVVMATNHHVPASPMHRTMKRLIAEGAIGEVRAIHINSAFGLPERLRDGWRLDDPVSGGVILDVFIHDMAAIAGLIGGQARRVSSMARTPSLIPDSVVSVVQWDGDVIVGIHDAYDGYHLPTYAEILGTEGALRSTSWMSGTADGEVVLFRGMEAVPVDVGPRDDLYLSAVRAFEQAAAGGGHPIVSGRDGVRSLAAALAAVRSLTTGCAQDVTRV